MSGFQATLVSDGRTHTRTDKHDFYKTFPANAEGPKNKYKIKSIKQKQKTVCSQKTVCHIRVSEWIYTL